MLVHLYQMHLETIRRRTRPVILQQASLDPWSQVNAHRAHVACYLAKRFLEAEEQTPFTPATRRIDKLCPRVVLPVPAVPDTRTLLPR